MKVSKILSSDAGKVLALVFGLLLLLSTTNPNEAPLLILFLPFILLYLLAYRSLILLLRQSIFGYVKNPKFFAATISGFLLSVLLLKSIDQLSVQDIALLILLTSVIVFYVQRNGFSDRL